MRFLKMCLVQLGPEVVLQSCFPPASTKGVWSCTVNAAAISVHLQRVSALMSDCAGFAYMLRSAGRPCTPYLPGFAYTVRLGQVFRVQQT
jgi:hypothetical protein